MNISEIASSRLHNQHLTGAPLASPVEVVQWLGAVQAQDYAGAKWGLGQRAQDVTDAALDRLFDAGAILRTHVLRPTWHFVDPADAYWLLQLTGPRLRQSLRGRHRRLELSERDIAHASDVLATALAGGGSLTRAELGTALRTAGIAPDGQRLPHLLLCAELDALIVSGPVRGRQFTWMLFDARAPKSPRLDPEEAAVRLVCRYLQSHGPALLQDFTWWSGLSLSAARRAVAAAGPAVSSLTNGGQAYWYVTSERTRSAPEPWPPGHLLSNWDEYTVGYRDRSAAVFAADAPHVARLAFGSILANVVTIDGRVRGGWSRAIGRQSVDVQVQPFGPMSRAELDALELAAERFGRFLGLPARLRIAVGSLAD